MGQRALAVAVLAVVATAATGCGGGSGTTTSGQRQRAETAQHLPKLPAGWNARRDRSIGYAIGVPTGWQVSGRRNRVLFRSPDHLVAVTLTADRSPRTFRIPAGRFATQALGALPGFTVPLEPSKPRPFKGTPLDALYATATGSQASGLKERATLVVLRRDRLVNYTVAVLENAEQSASALDRAVALRMVATLRDVPPAGSSGR